MSSTVETRPDTAIAAQTVGALVARAPKLELASDTIEWGASLFRVPGRLPMRLR